MDFSLPDGRGQRRKVPIGTAGPVFWGDRSLSEAPGIAGDASFQEVSSQVKRKGSALTGPPIFGGAVFMPKAKTRPWRVVQLQDRGWHGQEAGKRADGRVDRSGDRFDRERAAAREPKGRPSSLLARSEVEPAGAWLERWGDRIHRIPLRTWCRSVHGRPRRLGCTRFSLRMFMPISYSSSVLSIGPARWFIVRA
jgi:hypothetical protein